MLEKMLPEMSNRVLKIFILDCKLLFLERNDKMQNNQRNEDGNHPVSRNRFLFWKGMINAK